MNKKSICVTLLILLALVCALMDTTEASSPPTNTVKICPSGSGINTMTFTFGSVSITKGQSWESFDMNGSSGTTIVLNCVAGRSGSSTPAGFFKNNSCGGGTAYYASSEMPNSLNFAFTGELTINGNTYNVVIGQGHDSGGHNNWWMSGTSFHSSKIKSTSEYRIVTNDGLYTIIAGYEYVHPGADPEANVFNVSVNP